MMSPEALEAVGDDDRRLIGLESAVITLMRLIGQEGANDFRRRRGRNVIDCFSFADCLILRMRLF